MKKIRPSERLSKEIDEIISKGDEGEESLLSKLALLSTKKLIQEIMENEATEHLGREYFERSKDHQEGYRNGYKPKTIKTTEGKFKVQVPQIRCTEEGFRSQLLSCIGNLSTELERLATEMYVRGMRARDIEDALKDREGKPLLSKSSVCQITGSLSEEYETFIKRDLSKFDVVYLFVDGVYESMRKEAGAKEAIFCAWAILSNGNKVILHLGLGNKESYNSWQDFFRDMQRRGLRIPLLVISDGAPGLIRAINECFPDSKRQRCLVHKTKNIANKLPQSAVEQVMPEIKSVYRQTNHEIAMLCATKIIDNYGSKYPSAIRCFQDDLECGLNMLHFPIGHHKFIRTTNLLERAFGEQKRRTKVIPRFLDEKSCLKLAYATLIRVSDRWNKVKMSEFDLALLRNIRKMFGWKYNGAEFISMKRAA